MECRFHCAIHCDKIIAYWNFVFTCARDIAMRALYLVTVINIGLTLTGCSYFESTQPTSPTHQEKVTALAEPIKNYDLKDPVTVSFYSKGHPRSPYQIIGKETVSKFNHVGIKRQEAIIRDTMRQLAASIGGDAVIDVRHDKTFVTGTVIRLGKTEDV